MNKSLDRLKNRLKTNSILKIVLGIIALLSVACADYVLLQQDIVINIDIDWLFWVVIIIGAIVAYARTNNYFDGCLKSIAIGAGVAMIIYYLIWGIVTFVVYMVAGLLTLWLVLIAIRCIYRDRGLNRQYKRVVTPGFAELHRYPWASACMTS